MTATTFAKNAPQEFYWVCVRITMTIRLILQLASFQKLYKKEEVHKNHHTLHRTNNPPEQ